VKFIQHRRQIGRRLDQHGVKLPNVLVTAKGMFAGAEIVQLRHHRGQWAVQPEETILLPGLMLEKIVANPAHAEAGTNHGLVTAVSITGGGEELIVEGACAPLRVGNQERKPLPAGYVGGGLRRKVLRVDRYLETGFLQKLGGGQSDCTATQHRYWSSVAL